MSLTALIDKYRTDLAVSEREGNQEVVDKYRAFGSELAKLPSFIYTREDMRTAVAHMMDLGFDVYTRYSVASYAMRRSAMEVVSDVSVREDLFRIWDLAKSQIRVKEGQPKLREAIEGLVRNIGKPKVEEYLFDVQEGLKMVLDEVDAAWDIYQGVKADPKADEKAKVLAFQTAENHGQLIGGERHHVLGDVLKILRTI